MVIVYNTAICATHSLHLGLEPLNLGSVGRGANRGAEYCFRVKVELRVSVLVTYCSVVKSKIRVEIYIFFKSTTTKSQLDCGSEVDLH